MALAMIGLIIVQTYWINNAISVKENQFSQLINRVMYNVVAELQKQETVYHIIEEIEPVDTAASWQGISQFNLRIEGSEFVEEYSVEQEGNEPRKIVNQEYFMYQQSGTGDDATVTIISEDTSFASDGKPVMIFDTSKYKRVKVINPQKIQEELESQISEKQVYLDRIISKMISPTVQIEDRINPQVLNMIIDNELLNYGIDLDYEFAVLRDNLDVALSTDNYSPELNEDYFEAQLFPEDIFRRPSYLSMYFPRKTNFILKSLGFMAISSGILTIIIILSFSITIYIIFRQKRLSEIKNDFVNNMTHELKTPISTISLASQMLNDKSIPMKNKNMDHISTVIADESKRLGYQVEKVLQMAIFDRGRIKLKCKLVSVNDLLNSVVKNFEMKVNQKNGRIIEELNADNEQLMIDPVHFTNVISNLVDNAVKYSGENPEIYISTLNKNNKLLIRVKDNGIGIKKEDQKRVFEKFYRVPTGNVHNVKGFGLGLSYVKKIVEEHHGTVSLKSEQNKGTEFEICLPIQNNNKTK